MSSMPLEDKLRWIARDVKQYSNCYVFLERNKDGLVVDFSPLDNKSISKYIKEDGSTPSPPQPAYCQIWEGSPRIDLTTMDVLEITVPIAPGKFYPLPMST